MVTWKMLSLLNKRYIVDENRAIKPFGFAFAMQTDGHSARFRFKIRRVGECLNTLKDLR